MEEGVLVFPLDVIGCGRRHVVLQNFVNGALPNTPTALVVVIPSPFTTQFCIAIHLPNLLRWTPRCRICSHLALNRVILTVGCVEFL